VATEFEVKKQNTRSRDLIDDFMKSALLRDGSGGQYSPTTWDRTPSGGNNSDGVLRFKPIAPKPQSIELQIGRIGDDAPRSFRRQLK
jgi:hypothetical protein